MLTVQPAGLLRGLNDYHQCWALKSNSQSSIIVGCHYDLASWIELEMIKKGRARKGFREGHNEILSERHGPETDPTIQEKLGEMLAATHHEDR